MEEIKAKKEAKDSFKRWITLEKIHLRQNSKETWLREGDKNTSFFHHMANSHFRNNAFARIKINGVWISKDLEIREGISKAFQSLLMDNLGWRAELDRLDFATRSPNEARNLEMPFREEELFIALNEMEGDKASGPNGFTIAFWQESWHFVKEEIMELFKEFHKHESFTRSLNATFLVLISKKGGVEYWRDFMPINLLGSLYKILAEVLANRLKRMVEKIVSKA